MLRPTRTTHPTRPLWRSRARAGVLWCVIAGACVWAGCTVTKTNYKTLSFFFDGVPDPEATLQKGAPGDTTIAVAVVQHKPFLEEKCEACHKTQYRPSRNDPSACLSCHDKVMNQHEWTHGAVAGGACLWCHSPHESARKWLLRAPDRKLCMQCHSAALLTGDTVPAHADSTSGCVDCHYGHGGKTAVMLKPGATATTKPPPESAETQQPMPATATPATPEPAAPARVEPAPTRSPTSSRAPASK